MAEDVSCFQCGHGRRQHSRNGCTELVGKRNCPCKVTYMDLSPRKEK